MSSFIVVHSYDNLKERVVINLDHLVRIAAFRNGPRMGACVWVSRAGAAHDDYVETSETLDEVIELLLLAGCGVVAAVK